MLLSEAIRLGAMWKPQAFGELWDGGGSCALGAAYDAAGLTGCLYGWRQTLTVFPILASLASCPACNNGGALVFIVSHLNDDHRWTREAIADWVETIEAAQASALRGDREAAAVAVGCGETE